MRRSFWLATMTLALTGCGSDGSSDGDGGGGQAGAGAGGSSSGGAAGSAGSGGSVSLPPLVEGCPGQQLREGIPADARQPGPWPVGAVTTQLGGVTTEVFYPAVPGSDDGATAVVYDIRDQLPDGEKDRIPDTNNPAQPCDCYRDLPLDVEAGPFPVLVFIHGTAGFRTTNLENTVHWASRGFVVVSSDHPGIRLGDLLAGALGTMVPMPDQAGDARRVLDDLASPSGEAAFLAGALDLTRVGAMGHSAGGGAVSTLGDVADVIIPYAGGGALTADRVQSSFHVIGDADAVVAASTEGYDGSTTPTRRATHIAAGGHLVGGSLCTLRDPTDPSKDIIDIAVEFGLGGQLAPLIPMFFGRLFDGCNELADDDTPFIPASRGIEILSATSTAVFEETLHCSEDATTWLAGAEQTFAPDISLYLETTP